MTIRYSTGAATLLCAVLLSGAAYAVEGEVKIVLPEQPANLDPCRSIRSDIGRIINSNITETLTAIEPEKGTVAPWLADKWEQVNDLTWRVHLKERRQVPGRCRIQRRRRRQVHQPSHEPETHVRQPLEVRRRQADAQGRRCADRRDRLRQPGSNHADTARHGADRLAEHALRQGKQQASRDRSLCG